jgi:hypothetical protein
MLAAKPHEVIRGENRTRETSQLLGLGVRIALWLPPPHYTERATAWKIQRTAGMACFVMNHKQFIYIFCGLFMNHFG